MREILFRAKSVWGNWCEGYLVKMPNYFRMSTRDDLISFGVDAETIGQFTGLTDKNGKKIFEDDIVKAKASHPCGGDVIETVVVSLDDYELMWDLDHSHEIEVIGNIHDNPELLEAK